MQRHLIVAPAAAFGLALPLAAQSVSVGIPLQGEFHLVGIGANDGCSGQALRIGGEIGSITFDGLGGFTSNRTATTVCATGPNPVENYFDVGSYTLDTSGKLTLDYDPAQPGTDTFEMFMTPDLELAIRAPEPSTESTGCLLLCRKQAAASQTDLEGDHGFVQILNYLGGDDFTCESSYGTFDVDAAGVASLNLQVHAVDPFGFHDFPLSGPYGPLQVQADGSLTVESTTVGAISAGGEFGYIFGTDDQEVSLALFVRQAESMVVADLDGTWSTNSYGGVPGLFSNHEAGTIVGPLTIDGATGACQHEQTFHSVTPSGVSTSSGSLSGNVTVAADGSFLQVYPSDATYDGWFSADSTVAIFADIGTSSLTDDVAEAGIYLRHCASSAPFGVGSAGTGGVVPTLSTTGLAKTGNASYSLDVAAGVGGGLAFFAYSGTALLDGFPLFGGTVYLDPSQYVLLGALPLSGAAGAPGAGSASFAIPIPANPAFVGAGLYSQALIFDPGASESIATTQAVSLILCE
jgi:hypothetical protein